MTGHRLSLVDRFWAKVDKGDGTACWNWTAAQNGAGYGVIGLGGRKAGIERAHRLSWMLAVGPIEEGLFVCHRCDNRRCVRPDHLFLGTNGDNHADMMAKGRGAKPPVHIGIANPRARLITFDGKTLCIDEWSRLKGIKGPTIRMRLKSGWSVDDALTKVVA